MLRETRDYIERKVAALELWIGIEHNGNINRVSYCAKIGFDLRILERKESFEDRQNAVGTELLVGLRLFDRVRGRGRYDAGDHRHLFRRSLDRCFHHRFALRTGEIGKLAGRTE